MRKGAEPAVSAGGVLDAMSDVPVESAPARRRAVESMIDDEGYVAFVSFANTGRVI